MTRTAVATDDFNRAAGPVGSNWTYIRPTTFQAAPPEVVLRTPADTSTGVIRGRSSGTNYQVIRWDGAGTFTDDQYAELTLTDLAFAGNTRRYGVVVRCSADLNASADFYAFYVLDDGSSNRTTKLVRMVDGTETELDSTTRAWADGDTIELEAVTNGSQVDLYCYKNGALITGLDPLSDTNAARLLTGKPGILVAGNTSDTGCADDWEGGSLGSATPSAAPSDVPVALSVEAPSVSFTAAGASVTPSDVALALSVEAPAASASSPASISDAVLALVAEAPAISYTPPDGTAPIADVPVALSVEAPALSYTPPNYTTAPSDAALALAVEAPSVTYRPRYAVSVEDVAFAIAVEAPAATFTEGSGTPRTPKTFTAPARRNTFTVPAS